MKIYFIKHDQPYSEQDSDVFEKDSIKIEDNILPVRLNWGEVVGKTKIYSNEVGCFIETIEYHKDKVQIDLTKDINIEFGFIVEDSEFINNVRHIRKANITGLSIRQ